MLKPHLFKLDESLLPSGAKIVAAVSGGADSLALLHELLKLDRDMIVGHVHHDLHEIRHGACSADARWLQLFCEKLKVPCHILPVTLPRKCREGSAGHVNEAVAREARYRALRELAEQESCTCLATGHSATDNLETVLLNLGRGATVRGLGGFAPARAFSPALQLVRPMWHWPRGAARALLREAGWEWLEDKSNHLPEFRRNRIRHEVLPLLGAIFEKSEDELARAHAAGAAVVREEGELLEQLAQAALPPLVLKHETGVLSLDAPMFLALHAALQRRVLRLAARRVNPLAPELPPELPLELVEELRAQVGAGARRRVWCAAGGLRVEWTGPMAGNRLRLWCVNLPSTLEMTQKEG